MAGQQINWDKVNSQLPYEKDPAAKAQRDDLWNRIDVNGNGYLSLAEVDKGIRDELALTSLYDAKPAIMRAFQAAKRAVKTKSPRGGDYVERPEFRLLLLYLREYFELFRAFERVDTGDDRRVDFQEFVKARPLVEKWVGPLPDYEDEFAKIDKNGGGQVLFDEFAEWAIAKKLDLEDDDA
ncbi:flagellar calcium-binding protein-like protein TB-44A [Xylariaceae sp. FL0016]|nr:flagellar calcium-binding protein-like protein TB-44A [Xylariaceae sp. FL0016]